MRIKIERNKWYNNKTKKYLFPLLLHYSSTDSNFSILLNSIYKVALGLGDLKTKDIIKEPAIYVLVDTSIEIEAYKTFKNNLKNKDFVLSDYSFKVKGEEKRFHMFVIKIHESFLKRTLPAFLNGEYSKMYSNKIINKYFFQEEDAYHILKKTKKGKKIGKKIFEEFFKFDMSNIDLVEYDIQPFKNEELFNYPSEAKIKFFEKDFLTKFIKNENNRIQGNRRLCNDS